MYFMSFLSVDFWLEQQYYNYCRNESDMLLRGCKITWIPLASERPRKSINLMKFSMDTLNYMVFVRACMFLYAAVWHITLLHTWGILVGCNIVLFPLFSLLLLNSLVSQLLELGVWYLVWQRCRVLKIGFSSVNFLHDVLLELNKTNGKW